MLGDAQMQQHIVALLTGVAAFGISAAAGYVILRLRRNALPEGWRGGRPRWPKTEPAKSDRFAVSADGKEYDFPAGQAVRASETGGLVVERADGTVRPLRRRDVEPGNAVINPGSGVVGIEGLRDAIREHEEQIPFRPGLAPEGEGRDFSRGEVDKMRRAAME